MTPAYLGFRRKGRKRLYRLVWHQWFYENGTWTRRSALA